MLISREGVRVMGSKFPAEIQELLTKLDACRKQAAALGFDSGALLIASATREIEELAELRIMAALAKKNPSEATDASGL
jgi:predicted esterase